MEPKDPVFTLQLAVIYSHCEEFQQAIELFQRILKDLNPKMVDCYYFIAHNYTELGYFNEAYYHVKKYLEKDPDGKYKEEAEELLYLIETEDDDFEYSLYEQDELMMKQEEARWLLETGNFEKALIQLRELIEKYPDYWSSYNNMALAYFYLGQVDQAVEVLEELLEKNPGNLHGLCNLAVFFYHHRRDEELGKILEGLEKVQPLSTDHQYKLGATFAIVGRYEQAYYWLNLLKKRGFEGDASFYYWLSNAAHHTGQFQVSKAAWEQLLKLDPEKKGREPWFHQNEPFLYLEEDINAILKMLSSDKMVERLFAIFLLGNSSHRDEIIAHPDFKDLNEFSLTEKLYLSHVLATKTNISSNVKEMFVQAHQVACLLHEHHRPIHTNARDLFLLWFSIFLEGLKKEELFKNENAYAAATDYVWNKLNGGNLSQAAIAKQYHISVSTLQKYAKKIRMFIQ